MSRFPSPESKDDYRRALEFQIEEAQRRKRRGKDFVQGKIGHESPSPNVQHPPILNQSPPFYNPLQGKSPPNVRPVGSHLWPQFQPPPPPRAPSPPSYQQQSPPIDQRARWREEERQYRSSMGNMDPSFGSPSQQPPSSFYSSPNSFNRPPPPPIQPPNSFGSPQRPSYPEEPYSPPVPGPIVPQRRPDDGLSERRLSYISPNSNQSPYSASPNQQQLYQPPASSISALPSGIGFGSPDSQEMAKRRAAEEKKRIYALELEQQMRDKQAEKEKKLMADREAERKKDIEMMSYNPYGRPGAGAPMRDDRGEVITSLVDLRAQGQRSSPLRSHPPPASSGSSFIGGFSPQQHSYDSSQPSYRSPPSYNSNYAAPSGLLSPAAPPAVSSGFSPSRHDPSSFIAPQALNFAVAGAPSSLPPPQVSSSFIVANASPNSHARFRLEHMEEWQKEEHLRKHRQQTELQDELKSQMDEKKRKKEEEIRRQKMMEDIEEEKVRHQQEEMRLQYEREHQARIDKQRAANRAAQAQAAEAFTLAQEEHMRSKHRSPQKDQRVKERQVGDMFNLATPRGEVARVNQHQPRQQQQYSPPRPIPVAKNDPPSPPTRGPIDPLRDSDSPRVGDLSRRNSSNLGGDKGQSDNDRLRRTKSDSGIGELDAVHDQIRNEQSRLAQMMAEEQKSMQDVLRRQSDAVDALRKEAVEKERRKAAELSDLRARKEEQERAARDLEQALMKRERERNDEMNRMKERMEAEADFKALRKSVGSEYQQQYLSPEALLREQEEELRSMRDQSFRGGHNIPPMFQEPPATASPSRNPRNARYQQQQQQQYHHSPSASSSSLSHFSDPSGNNARNNGSGRYGSSMAEEDPEDLHPRAPSVSESLLESNKRRLESLDRLQRDIDAASKVDPDVLLKSFSELSLPGPASYVQPSPRLQAESSWVEKN